MNISTANQSLNLLNSEIKENISNLSLNKLTLNKLLSEIEKKLFDEIECPKCKFHFLYNDKSIKINDLKNNKKEKIQEINNIENEINGFQELSADIDFLLNELNDYTIYIEGLCRDSIQKNILLISESINDLNQNIVILQDDEFKIKEEKNKELQRKQLLINNVTTATRKLENKKEDIGHDLIDYINAVRKQENLLTNKKDENGFQKQKFTNLKNSRIQSLNQKESEIKANDESMLALEKQIEVLRSTEADQTKILKIQDDIIRLQIEQNRISIKLEEFRKEKESIDAWELNFKSFKSTLANKSIKNIEDFSNLYLQNMGSNLQICIDGYKTLSSKKIKESISTSVLRDGFDAGSYGKFSGGERGRISLSVILSIQELINLNSGYGGVDLLICDEILDQIDLVGMDSIIKSLQPLQKSIMIISQNEVDISNEFVITIQKQNRVSTILN